jgi:spore germination protein
MTNQDMQNNVIQKTLEILKTKGFYGLYLGFQHFLPNDLPLYVNFINKVTRLMNSEGFEVFVSLIPGTFGFKPGVQLAVPYYQQIGQAVNYVTLITYQWTTSFISQFNETTPGFLKEYLDFVITQIPAEKIFLGLSRIAYDWELPYVEGETPVSFLTNAGAVSLANQVNSTILHDEVTQTPYFNYNSLAGVQHFVWFKDAKSADAVMELVRSYNLAGVAVWNIMYYYSPTFLVINSQYDIKSVLNQSPSTPS